MPKPIRHMSAFSETDNEHAPDSTVATILVEVREIKKQNKNFREETKKELEDLRMEIQRKDDKWDNDKNKLIRGRRSKRAKNKQHRGKTIPPGRRKNMET
jgi:hypothetical protein